MSYPNTVPQTKVSVLKNFAELDDKIDHKMPAFSSANLSNARRRNPEM